MVATETTEQLVDALVAAATLDDSDALRTASERLIAHLPQRPGTIEASLARGVLDALRMNRRFGYMRRLAQAFIDDGCEDHRIIQHFAQALIEGGEALPAIRVLEGLAADPTISPYDWAEAKGALGRAWKDRAVRARISRPDLARHAIRQAFGHYSDAWRRDDANDYQGVNAVALAAWDRGFALSPADLDATKDAARDIFQRLANTPIEKLQNWDFATAGEALLGMDRLDEAVRWYADYAQREESAFALASTVRQLVQLWDIGSRSGGEALLATLTGKLGRLPGGGFSMSPEMLLGLADVPQARHEALLGETGALGWKWLQDGIGAARSVALIRKNGKAHGTGFAVRGSDLDPGFGAEILLVTNAHVVSDRQERLAAHPDEASVTFELSKDGNTENLPVKEIVWQSPSSRHDVAVLRLDGAVPESVRPLKLHDRLPVLKVPPSSRVYVIGHPGGREVSFSFQDNLLLDYERDVYEASASRNPCRIHYRAPTEPGSSGSPVFDSQWRVIGVHHAGGKQLWALNGRREVYAANEGMWIEAIRRAMAAGGDETLAEP